MEEIKFSCTMCGRCCYDHSIPLTFDEAISWLEEGGRVALYCEADLLPSEPLKEDLRAAHRRRRSFAASCGSSQIRVTTILVAAISGACKNLDEDLKCRIYERRPLVCRIYPAEINPFIQLNTANKACPPEAWISGKTIASPTGMLDPEVQSPVEKSRQIDQDNVPQKRLLCRYLGIDVAAFAGEGFVAYEPGHNTLLDALREARGADLKNLNEERAWRLYSPSLLTTESLRAMGAEVAAKKPDDGYSFLFASTARPKEAPLI